jgi:hypothetical protein
VIRCKCGATRHASDASITIRPGAAVCPPTR